MEKLENISGLQGTIELNVLPGIRFQKDSGLFCKQEIYNKSRLVNGAWLFCGRVFIYPTTNKQKKYNMLLEDSTKKYEEFFERMATK